MDATGGIVVAGARVVAGGLDVWVTGTVGAVVSGGGASVLDTGGKVVSGAVVVDDSGAAVIGVANVAGGAI